MLRFLYIYIQFKLTSHNTNIIHRKFYKKSSYMQITIYMLFTRIGITLLLSYTYPLQSYKMQFTDNLNITKKKTHT